MTSNLTTEDITRAEQDDRWAGHGYLGERRHTLDDSDPQAPARLELVQQVDAVLIEHANRLGWDYERLFTFLDSRAGRHFGDTMFDRWARGSLETRLNTAIRRWNAIAATSDLGGIPPR